MNKYFGIIVSSFLFNRIKKQLTTNECILFYEEACKQYGFIPCYFRIVDIDLTKKNMKALVLNEKDEYVFRTITKPEVIHNRGLGFLKREQKKIETLQRKGINIFNECTQYSKIAINNILKNNGSIKPHMPDTGLANKKNFYEFLSKYKNIIIKPNNGSLGKGIMTVSHKKNDICSCNILGESKVFSKKKPLPLVVDQYINPATNIIQQRIPLATYKDLPFDIRVSVQKNKHGVWQVSGLVAKVAKKGLYVTNVASGGKCYPLETVLSDNDKLNAEEIKEAIKKLSLNVSVQLDNHLPHIADLGLDIGITENGYPMLIECNFRDLRYSFREAGLIDEWKRTYFKPVEYAHFLLERMKIDN
ncbi:YheC/YheD family protein [Metabacillus halosaccharovorans]|uniref:YheC/YheD family endospore coat-associated protein n=1 Tax=Metabacillus halosaccharovorans TaxID=930124 RepID=UPI001C1FDDA5|nr:YheC/YheD family protein [Metabacillus halosaccharovorans]MBU7592269.1 YheC/YheD family protein [Metabacillus halosaccharovorans]